MAQVGDAEQVVLQGLWLDEDGVAVDGTITLDPVPLTGQSGSTPNLKDATSFAYIKTKQRVATPDPATGYFAVLALASDDPDVDAYGGRKVTFSGGYTPYTIQVPYNAPNVTVTSAMAAQVPSLTVGASVRALWLIDAPDGSNPPTPVESYYDSTQVNSLLAAQRQVPDPSTGTTGQAVVLTGTNTYGWGTVSGGGGSSALTPTTIFTSNSHVPASGELARYNPSSSWSITLAAAAAGQRFGVTNVAASGSNTATFVCAGSDTFSDGTTTLVLKPGERAVLIGATGGFTVESRTILVTLTTQLLQWTYAEAFQLSSATRDTNEAITTASVVWPDGSTGTFTTDTASTAFPGAIDAYHVTYVPSVGATKTITQPAVTRDSAGAVTAQPAIAVS